jgi:hypothetical protein
MARRGERDRGKERLWRRLLRQWRRSGQSVRDFCAAQQLSEPSFYGWRRTIAARDRQAATRPRLASPRRLAGSQRGQQRRNGDASASSDQRRGSNTPVFVPVRLAPPALAALEVVVGDGRVVRVPAGFDAATLRQLLAVLDEAPPC